jgi:peptidoglycan-associated lipoprotein
MMIACPPKSRSDEMEFETEPDSTETIDLPDDSSSTATAEIGSSTVSSESYNTTTTTESANLTSFQKVYFDFDKYNLREDALVALHANLELMIQNPSLRVRIEGHCDERGTNEYNQALGNRRALACKNFLVQKGVESSRIEVISYGEERPIDPGHNEAAWALNRRGEFIVLQ